MSSLTYAAQNKALDALFRGQALGAPATLYLALFRATRGKSNSIRSTVVSSGDTVIPATPNGRMYRCSTGGTTAAGEPTWPTTPGGTVNDGTAVWTEMTPDFLGNTGNLTEVAGGAYARVSYASTLANWAGTQGAGTTAASSGTSGQTSNNNLITFPAPVGADWGVISHLGCYDQASGGVMWNVQPLTNPKTVNDGDSALTIAAGAFTETLT